MAMAALVTGSARRIGRAVSLRLAREGYSIALHVSPRAVDDGQALAAEIEAMGAKAHVIAADLAEPDVAPMLIGKARAALGPLSLLVNNASIFEPDAVDALEAERWDRHFAVNLRAPVMLAAEFARGAAPGASVVNIVDQRVLRLTPRYFSYTLAKSALWTATQTMAQAYAPQIRVNAVGPGPVLPNQNEGEAGFQLEASRVPLEHAVDPAEIAEAVAYLAQARSVTGQMICVDSGQHIAWKTPDAIV